MRIFRDLKEAAREIERDLYEMGINSYSVTHQNRVVGQDFKSKELLGYSYSVPMLINRIFDELKVTEALSYMGKDPQASLDYIITEFQDRLNTSMPNPGSSCELNPELWDQFKNSDGTFDYTYSERFNDYFQLQNVIKELEGNKESRRAVLSVYDTSKDVRIRLSTGRIPCSMYYQFFIRTEGDKELIHCLYTMRSCDFYEHWIHDVLMAMLIAEYVKNQLPYDLEMGNLFHQLGSFHIFEKDYSKRNIF
jgi:thymidylate synthase